MEGVAESRKTLSLEPKTEALVTKTTESVPDWIPDRVRDRIRDLLR